MRRQLYRNHQKCDISQTHALGARPDNVRQYRPFAHIAFYINGLRSQGKSLRCHIAMGRRYASIRPKIAGMHHFLCMDGPNVPFGPRLGRCTWRNSSSSVERDSTAGQSLAWHPFGVRREPPSPHGNERLRRLRSVSRSAEPSFGHGLESPVSCSTTGHKTKPGNPVSGPLVERLSNSRLRLAGTSRIVVPP